MAGKFEAEPRWAEYFWDLVILGNEEEEWEAEDGTLVSSVRVADEDRERYPELTAKYVYLWEDSQGFVWTATNKARAPKEICNDP